MTVFNECKFPQGTLSLVYSGSLFQVSLFRINGNRNTNLCETCALAVKGINSQPGHNDFSNQNVFASFSPLSSKFNLNGDKVLGSFFCWPKKKKKLFFLG